MLHSDSRSHRFLAASLASLIAVSAFFAIDSASSTKSTDEHSASRDRDEQSAESEPSQSGDSVEQQSSIELCQAVVSNSKWQVLFIYQGEVTRTQKLSALSSVAEAWACPGLPTLHMLQIRLQV